MRAKKRIKKGCAMLLAGALAASSLPAAGTLKVSAAEPEEKEYTADWESVEQVDTAPEWFQDAKFGIYFHWGAFTTPERIDEWYGQHIYNGSGAAYDYHVNTYGDLLDWPYHNFILGAEDRQGNWVQFAPKLTADYEGGSEDGKFDPKAWAKLFKEAGAKFAGPVMEHHDGYSMWDSDVTPWNSVDTGPHLDLAGLFVDAIRDEDMKVLSAMHHAYNVTGGFYGSAWDERPWDTPAEGYTVEDMKKLYGQFDTAEERDEFWLAKLKEIIDKYDPDIIWQDFKVGELGEEARLEFLSYFYNKDLEENGEGVVATYKYNHEINDGFTEESAVPDYERGGPGGSKDFYWLTDDSVSQTTWSYTDGMTYYSAKSLIHALADKISKNGNLLLNISPRADGSIPVEQQEILLEIGDWLERYGEAVYSTRAWSVYGEGKSVMGGGVYQTPTEGTAEDIRFTRSKDSTTLYAIALGNPADGTMDIKTLRNGIIDKDAIAGIYAADGTEAELEYTQDEEGLHIALTEAEDAVDENGRAVKIVFKNEIPEVQGVTLWSEGDFKGTAATLVPGVYDVNDLQEMGVTADTTSSIQVPEGYAVYFYDEGETTGSYGILEKDSASLGNWNDRIAAVKIVKNTEAFEEIQPEEGKTYQLVLRNNPDYVLEYNGAAENGANVQIGMKQEGAENQQWIFTETDGYYVISPAANPALCIDIESGNYSNGANLILWEYGSGADNRKWKLDPTESGYYSIHSKGNDSFCIDESLDPPADNANVQLWQYEFGDRQQWALEEIGAETDAADKTALNLVIAMAEKLEAEQSETGCYTEETWAAVQTALDTARTLAENAEASQEDVDNAFLELITAVNLLENAVQRVALQTAIEGARAILAEEEALADYTPESVENLRTVLADAERVYAEAGADQETVNAAARSLMDAVTSLVVIDKDTRLDILIQKAEELLASADQYTSVSVANLQAALEAAQLVADDRDASEEQVNAAYSSLAEAISSLVRMADKSELKTALDKAAEILADTSKYVEESVAGLQAAADAAQAVYDKEDADTAAVGEAVKSLVNEILKARLMGDVDGDGTVDTADSAKVLEAAAEAQALDEMQSLAADVNRDGAADSSDAAGILQFAAEQKDTF